jgi:S-adenosylhomocysteine hydrolase
MNYYIVRDTALADFGRKELDIAEMSDVSTCGTYLRI